MVAHDEESRKTCNNCGDMCPGFSAHYWRWVLDCFTTVSNRFWIQGKNGRVLFCSQREDSIYSFWGNMQYKADFQRQLLIVCPKVKHAFAYGTLCFGILCIENWDATRRLRRVALSKRLDRYLWYHSSVARVNVKYIVSSISSQCLCSYFFGVHCFSGEKLKEMTEFVLVKSTTTIVDLILRPLRLLIVVIGFKRLRLLCMH